MAEIHLEEQAYFAKSLYYYCCRCHAWFGIDFYDIFVLQEEVKGRADTTTAQHLTHVVWRQSRTAQQQQQCTRTTSDTYEYIHVVRRQSSATAQQQCTTLSINAYYQVSTNNNVVQQVGTTVFFGHHRQVAACCRPVGIISSIPTIIQQ